MYPSDIIIESLGIATGSEGCLGLTDSGLNIVSPHPFTKDQWGRLGARTGTAALPESPSVSRLQECCAYS